MLKYLPQKSLKITEDVLLYNKKRVSCTCNIDRRLNNSNIPADITNNNIDDRLPKFAGVTNNKKVSRIPLRYFITCSLETDMKKFFESKKKSTIVVTPDEKIIFIDAPYIQ